MPPPAPADWNVIGLVILLGRTFYWNAPAASPAYNEKPLFVAEGFEWYA